jgi:succinoglycan biosynthesis transport protein ExoP
LESAQLKYQEMLSKQTEAQVSQNLEAEHQGERFTMIEPPLPPEKPISPNRSLILMLGLIVSLSGGVGAAFTRDGLDASVRSAHDIRSLLSVPPLAVIPVIQTAAERRKYRRKVSYRWIGVIVCVVALLAIVHVAVLPLDVLWFGLLRRIGIT